MATTVVETVDNAKYRVATWASLGVGETGVAAYVGRIAGVKTFQLTGTFGGGTVELQGSMDNVNWFPLRSADYTTGDYTILTALAAAMLTAIIENPQYIRPVVTGGAGTALKVIVGGNSLI